MTRESKLVLGGLIGIVLAFLVGFGWQYTRARAAEKNLDGVTHELTFKRLEATLAAATVEADRGNYEIARRLSSDFFTGLQDALPKAQGEQRMVLERIAAQRDAIITAASRSDVQTASLLGQLYSTYRVTFGGLPVTPQPGAAQPPAPATTTSQ